MPSWPFLCILRDFGFFYMRFWAPADAILVWEVWKIWERWERWKIWEWRERGVVSLWSLLSLRSLSVNWRKIASAEAQNGR